MDFLLASSSTYPQPPPPPPQLAQLQVHVFEDPAPSSRRVRLWTTPPVSRAKRRDERTSEERSKENLSWSLRNMADPNFVTPVKPNLQKRLSLGAPGLRRVSSDKAQRANAAAADESDKDDDAEDVDILTHQMRLMDVQR